MIRTLSVAAVAALCLSTSNQLFAGGPPFLSLPVDGVNAENVDACSALLNSKLEKTVNAFTRDPARINLVQRANQWYLVFYMGDDVRLSELKAALEGIKFSIPQDRLRFFGHVVLEIDAPATSQPALLSGLKGLEQVSVDESKSEENHLVVTVDMPYPVDAGKPDVESVGWRQFQRNDLNSTPSEIARVLVPTGGLPNYKVFRDVVVKHRGSLNDLRWSEQHACRPLGGTVEPENKVAAQSGNQ